MSIASVLMDPAMRRRVPLRTLGIGAAQVFAVAPGVALLAMPTTTPHDVLLVGWNILISSLMMGFGIALALEVHEQRAGRGRPLPIWATMVLAVLAVALFASMSPTEAAVRTGFIESPAALHLHDFWLGLFDAVISVTYLTQRRESLAAEARTHQHELQLQLARRRLNDSSARAAQARLDPAILFRCLGDAGTLYGTDTAGGDLLLDRLTTYLRTALAASTRSADSLEQELKMASALMALEPRSAALASSLSPAASASRVPPGVLVQLLTAWGASLPVASASASTFRLVASRQGKVLRLQIDGPSAPPPEAVAQCRIQLAAMLAARSFTVDAPASGSVVITMESSDES
jgi:hypothetical protein